MFLIPFDEESQGKENAMLTLKIYIFVIFSLQLCVHLINKLDAFVFMIPFLTMLVVVSDFCIFMNRQIRTHMTHMMVLNMRSWKMKKQSAINDANE